MEKITIKDKYEIKDTLYTDEFQSVFVCNLVESEDQKNFIISEFRDTEIIEEIKDPFIFNKDILSLVESFEIDEKFYVVFPMLYGTSLDEYISKHNLTIADKMYFTEGILKKFIAIDNLSYAIQYVLCDLNNISVQNRRFLHFNNLFFFLKKNLKVGSLDIIKKLGHLFLCVFSNNPNADIEKDKHSLPPAILPIVTKCIEGSYDSIGKVYADFRNTLLYTTFIDTGSLDNQIRNKMVKAQKKQSSAAPRTIALILILAALFGGGFWFIKNKNALTGPGSGISIIGKKGNPPIADFSISINKIYKDDEVKFVDKSVASNPGDVIKARLWTIEKDGTVIMNSDRESITYSFDEIGEYRVSLIAQDSRGIHSKPYTHSISVLEKPEIPEDIGTKTDNSFDRK